MHDPYVEELAGWVAIPSVSADPAHADDVRRAGEWACELVRRAGGECGVVDFEGRPLALGEVRASQGADRAPTVLVYGHFDVQPPGSLDAWEAEPFVASVRNGWLYGRGVADDKGPLYTLLKGAALLAEEGSLPVNVRVACDGEEEVGGETIIRFLETDERGADAAVIFDAAMLRRDLPALDVATRGMAYFHVRVTTGERDLHSGLYGGAALNAMHALMAALAGVLPRDGRLPDALRVGTAPPTEDELADWRALRPGSEELAEQGARPADDRAADEFYLRTWAEPSVDVNGITGGEANLQKTVIPAFAEANVSIRLAPGQSVDEVAPAVERLLRESAPPGADLDVKLWSSAAPGLVDPRARAVELAGDAFERAFGVRPALVRSGGTLPIVPALVDRGIPVVLTGLALPESNIHAPNERLPAEYVGRGVETAKELYRALAALR